MTRTQIQLPEELYERAKRFAAKREISLAEMTRRGLELFLERYPDPETAEPDWKLPKIRKGRDPGAAGSAPRRGGVR